MKYKTEYVSQKYPVGKMFASECYGPFKILGQLPASRYAIQFLNTGFITEAISTHIKTGNVKDYYMPQVYGVGYLGKGKHLASYLGKATKEYQLWVGMLERCYSDRYEQAGLYVGTTVDKRWHCFQDFCEDIIHLDGYAQWKTGHYQIDKDKSGKNIYSKDTCVFISQKDNVSEMNVRTKSNSKVYQVVAPSGKIHEVYSIRQFCRTYSLNPANFHKMLTGKATVCNGWKLF